MPVVPSSGQVDSGGKKSVITCCITTLKFYRHQQKKSMRNFHAIVIKMTRQRGTRTPQNWQLKALNRCLNIKKAFDPCKYPLAKIKGLQIKINLF